MSKRFQHLRDLGDMVIVTERAYHNALSILIASLPASHARAYRVCSIERVNSSYLSKLTGWSQNQTADILRELYEIGLVHRIPVDTRQFVYWARHGWKGGAE